MGGHHVHGHGGGGWGGWGWGGWGWGRGEGRGDRPDSDRTHERGGGHGHDDHGHWPDFDERSNRSYGDDERRNALDGSLRWGPDPKGPDDSRDRGLFGFLRHKGPHWDPGRGFDSSGGGKRHGSERRHPGGSSGEGGLPIPSPPGGGAERVGSGRDEAPGDPRPGPSNPGPGGGGATAPASPGGESRGVGGGAEGMEGADQSRTAVPVREAAGAPPAGGPSRSGAGRGLEAGARGGHGVEGSQLATGHRGAAGLQSTAGEVPLQGSATTAWELSAAAASAAGGGATRSAEAGLGFTALGDGAAGLAGQQATARAGAGADPNALAAMSFRETLPRGESATLGAPPAVEWRRERREDSRRGRHGEASIDGGAASPEEDQATARTLAQRVFETTDVELAAQEERQLAQQMGPELVRAFVADPFRALAGSSTLLMTLIGAVAHGHGESAAQQALLTLFDRFLDTDPGQREVAGIFEALTPDHLRHLQQHRALEIDSLIGSPPAIAEPTELDDAELFIEGELIDETADTGAGVSGAPQQVTAALSDD